MAPKAVASACRPLEGNPAKRPSAALASALAGQQTASQRTGEGWGVAPLDGGPSCSPERRRRQTRCRAARKGIEEWRCKWTGEFPAPGSWLRCCDPCHGGGLPDDQPLGVSAPRGVTKTYSKRTIDLVRRSLVIDMLAPIKLDFRPDYFAAPLSEKDAAEFRASGITGFHNAVGVGGKDARASVLEWMNGWQGFVGRNSHVFSLVGLASDLDRAKREGKCAVIMGLQNSDHFDTVADPEPAGVGQHRPGGWRHQRLWRGDHQGDERGRHAGRRLALGRQDHARRDRHLDQADRDHAQQLPRAQRSPPAEARRGSGAGQEAGEPTTIVEMVNHIDHVVKLIGIDHVGIGSDADLNGYDDMPADQYKMLKGGYKESYAFRDKLDTGAGSTSR
ncbi:membrane dipeptidase (Peptidase family m19) domain-containing protein [Ditylenchus destructor]|uniref:Membrane dipeptidase (Peptidase family m19) domain-containing protein n=1 Tax=Ditylenchus destructor TaxID=166010 RepID=A0AAD4QTN2_9BILA|nr:membrane dipeptidase (Peptidase family m19) domain-containing protein [Ditylenchus destructor]